MFLIFKKAISIKSLLVHWNSAIIPLSSIAFRANLAWKNLVNISFCAPVLNRTLDTQRREVNFEKIQNILTQAVFSDRVTLNCGILLDVLAICHLVLLKNHKGFKELMALESNPAQGSRKPFVLLVLFAKDWK